MNRTPLVLVVTAAFALASLPGARQAGLQGSTWTRRAASLGTALSGPEAASNANELGSLLFELEVELDRSPSRDVTRAYVAASLYLARLPDESRPVARSSTELFDGARTVAKQFGGPDEQALIELECAMHWRDHAEFEKAIRLIEQALEQLPEARGRLPSLHLAAAELQRKTGQFDDALRSIDAAEAGLLDQQGFASHARQRSDVFGARGHVMLGLGLPDLAARQFQAQHEQALAAQYVRGETLAALGRADLGLLTEDFHGVRDLLEPMLSGSGSLEQFPASRAYARVLLGTAYAELERGHAPESSRAEELLTGALDDPDLIEDHRLAAELQLADLWLRRGKNSEAAAVLEASDGRLSRREGTATSVALERALWSAHSARLALTRDANEQAAALVALRAAYDGFLEAWSNTPRRPGGIGFLQLGTRRLVLDQLIALTLAVEGEVGLERALHDLCRAQALGTLNRSLEFHAPDLSTLRSHLTSPRRGVLLYLPSMDRSHLIGFDDTELWHLELPARDAIVAILDDLLPVIARSPAVDAANSRLPERRQVLRSGTSQLGSVLLPPRARAALERWDAVSIVGADLFGALPLACLRLDEDRTLGEDWALSRAPSLPLAIHLARPLHSRDPSRLLVVAGTQTAPEFGLPPIPLGEREREQLLRGFREEESSWLTGIDASTSNVIDTLDGSLRPALMHIVAHGRYDSALERGAAIALAGSDRTSGLLTCQSAERAAAPPLTILSACGAARGPQRFGDDGVTDLGGAFLSAGSRAVVLSQFDLAHSATLELIANLQSHVRAGAALDEALRAARAALAADANYGDPYYHSLVDVVGWGGMRLFEAPPKPAPLRAPIAIGVFLAIGSVLWWRRPKRKSDSDPRRSAAH